MQILLLCDNNQNHADTILQHIAAFIDLSEHDVYIFNPLWLKNSRFLDLDEFDVVVVHYSLILIADHYLAPALREKLRHFRGLKIQFIQDDYRWVNQITAMMRYIGIHILFTLVPQSEIPKIWSETRLPGVIKFTTLAGYVPNLDIQPPPLESRSLDVGYRGRVIPYWIGKITQEKVWIGQGFLKYAQSYKLRCDIAWGEEDRIYGKNWVNFICSCRAVLGTESGSTITDFDGSIEKEVKGYLSKHPQADFWEVYNQILKPYESNVNMVIISPRMFEAIALKTGLILFQGEYSGILQPWVHYIPLKKDFSNMDEVIEKLKDNRFMNTMISRAYVDIVSSGEYSYKSFIKQFDQVVTQYAKPHAKDGKERYRLAQIERRLSLLFPPSLIAVIKCKLITPFTHEFHGKWILLWIRRCLIRIKG